MATRKRPSNPSRTPRNRGGPPAGSTGRRPKILIRLRIRKRPVLWSFLGLLGVLALVGLWALWPYWQLSGQFDDVPAFQPSRLYGRATELAVGQAADLGKILDELEAEGYRSLQDGERLAPGRFRRQGGTLTVFLRTFPTPAGRSGGAPLEIRVRGGRVSSLSVRGRDVRRATLEPPLLASYYGEDVKERRPVRVDEVPEELVEAVLAAEDDSFFSHAGLSFTGIARALWKNATGEGPPQGGSTITQQLVKNLYLTHERTLSRKIREAFLAIFLELRYSKRAILQAYLNEIYLGGSRGVNLIGVGAASRAYFGKDPNQLDLPESALLAGMIQAPAHYDPTRNPERARDRRNWVLERMVALGSLDRARADRARGEPVRTAPEPVVRRRAPYFADFAAQEAERRFGVDGLADAGYTILSTLDWDDQQAAQEAVAWGLPALEKGWEKGHEVAGPLQGALVSLDPETGAIRAYVGGRDYAESQFDRAGQARRQAGSAFKPVVYAAALESRAANPASLVEDAPLEVKLATQTWTPGNYDNDYHGWVTVRTALEESYNVATARLALQTGLQAVVDTARGLGVSAPLRPLPSLALGAFEVSPVELATVYATFATGGRRPAVHALDAVLDRHGEPVSGLALPEPERVLAPATSYVLTAMLQGVLDRGTGASARTQGLYDPVAGKTGTSNGRRDNWFAGYSPDRTTVVWVGYDDNSTTRMSGARAALPIWTRFVVKVRPPGGYRDFSMPPGVTTAEIDPETGELATDDCPWTLTEVFLVDDVPREVCHLHRDWWDRRYRDDRYGRADDRRAPRLRRLLRRIFGDEEDDERALRERDGEGENEGERREPPG
ncbi:MAG: PBP1A family penicillin-binding protein [Acidobacteriota bacterium]|jgi:penicillin-binding protein 1B